MKIPKFVQATVAFVMRLSKREKQMMYLAVGAVLIFGMDRLIVEPIHARMLSLNQEIIDKEAGVRKNLRILALKERIVAESLKLAPMLNKISFDEREVSGLLKEIEIYANESSVDLINIKPQGASEFGIWDVYQISLNCEGQLDELIEFMYKVENSNSLFLIKRYQITPKSRNSSEASCSMRVYKVIGR